MGVGQKIAKGLGVAGIGAALVIALRQARRTMGESDGDAEQQRDADGGAGRRVRKSIVVERPVAEVYAFWRDFENLPTFMHHLEEVRVDDADGRRSHWTAKAPLGGTVEWAAELTEDAPDERIAWRSVAGSDVQNAGVVRFEPAPGGGTLVRVELDYDPPAGPLGVAVAKLTGEEPASQTAADLRRLKQVMEVGEVVQSEATVGGRRIRQRPAQPLESEELAEARR